MPNKIRVRAAVFTTITIIFSIVIAVSFSPSASSFSNRLFFNNNGLAKQCVYAKMPNSNLANVFGLNYAATFCTPQFQTSITQGIGNRSSLTTNAASQYPYQSTYPYQFQSQQPLALPPSGSAAPAQYQNPNPYANQQQPQPPTATSNATTAAIPYPAPQSQGQQSPTLKVVTIVNNAGVGTANASNFSQVITNAFSNPDGYTYVYHFMRGSQMGVSLNLQQGIFTVSALNHNKTNSLFLNQSYDTTYSGDCNTIKSTTSTGSVYGYGTINPGEGKTCMVTKLFHKK